MIKTSGGLRVIANLSGSRVGSRQAALYRGCGSWQPQSYQVVKTTATNLAVAKAISLDVVAVDDERPNIMTKVPAAIGICAIIVLGSSMSACTNGGGNSVAGSSSATSGNCTPAFASGQRPGQRQT